MKKIIPTSLILSGLILTSTHVLASDMRIQREVYSSDRVYTINTKVGRTTLIQLEEGETLTMSDSTVLGMGDATAWNLSVRGNNIIFKQAQKQPETNLIIATNKRTYAFDLFTADKDTLATYVMRFTYPDTEAQKAVQEASKLEASAKLAAQLKTDVRALNFDYVWRGDNALLKPTAVWDDGRFTRLQYDHAGLLPVFFKVLPDGSEARINSNVDAVDGRIIVLQEVTETIKARLNDDVIEITNKAYALPAFNQHGVGIAGAIRTLKGDEQ